MEALLTRPLQGPVKSSIIETWQQRQFQTPSNLALLKTKGGTSRGKSAMKHKTIIHVDLDAFFAAVEVLDNPSLEGRPVIVGGSLQRGVVCSASYEARHFGVRSAMPVSQALSRCPQAVVLPVRRARYEELSQKVFEIFFEFTPLVEPLSIDEAFLDVTDCLRLHGTGRQIAESLRKAVRERIGLTASAGIAPIKMAAKIASDLCKPDGLLEVPPENVLDFLAPLPISRLWGVGPAAQKKLMLLGVKTIAHARSLPLELLEKQLGSLGRMVYALCRGQDDRQVTPAREALSIGRERTFMTDISDREKAQKKIFALCQSVAKRLRKENFSGRALTLKVKYADFSQVSRSMILERPADDAAELFRACLLLADKTRIGLEPVRLLGVSVSRPEKQGQGQQQSLFDPQETADKKKRLNRALDNITELYGEKAILPAMLVDEDSQ